MQVINTVKTWKKCYNSTVLYCRIINKSLVTLTTASIMLPSFTTHKAEVGE